METVSAKAFEDNVKALAVTTEGGFRDIDQQFSLGMSPEQRVKLQSANWVPYDQVKNSYTTKIADKINKLAKEYASKDMGVSENDARQEILQRLLQEGSAKKSLDGSLDMLEKTLKGIKNGSNRK